MKFYVRSIEYILTIVLNNGGLLLYLGPKHGPKYYEYKYYSTFK